MTPKNQTIKTIWFSPHEGYEVRLQHRLQEELGMDETAADAILHLRNQVIELQAQIRQLEAELAAHNANQHLRLSRYREGYTETTWIEVEIRD